jgi:hypothetical protein
MNVTMLVLVRMGMRRGSEAERRSGTRFSGFHVPVAGWRLGGQRLKQLLRDLRDAIDRAIEGFFVCLRRFREAAQLPNELKSRGADLFVRGRWREVMQSFDVSAHKLSSLLFGSIKMQRDRVSNSQAGSLAHSRVPLLLREPFVKIRAVVDVENVVVAVRKHGQLLMATGGFNSVD